jgi:tRNA dimethylallyltransferase
MKYDAVLIAGPTASGKSQVALALAEALGAVIVNADSMQVYRELRILTARPTAADMARAPHYLYGHVSVRDAYSVGLYIADVQRLRRELRDAGKPLLFVGGTGLYFEALTKGLADIPPVPGTVRSAVRAKFGRLEGPAIHAVLSERDPEMASELRPSDRQRMLRALEVIEATGRSLACWQKQKTTPALQGMRLGKFVIDVPRELLRERISSRLRSMISHGVLEEVAVLERLDPALPAAKILGLRELIALRAGYLPEEDAAQKVAILTAQYAKRQVTWARQRMADWTWERADEPHTIIAEILQKLI